MGRYKKEIGALQEDDGIADDVVPLSLPGLQVDTWTSPFSKKHVLSIIAHFVDENWKRKHLQLI